MISKIKDILSILGVLLTILTFYINYQINKSILPLQLEITEIRTTMKMWIKQGEMYRQIKERRINDNKNVINSRNI